MMYFFGIFSDIISTCGFVLGVIISCLFILLLIVTFLVLVGFCLSIIWSIGFELFRISNRLFYSLTGKGIKPERINNWFENFQEKTRNECLKIQRDNYNT